MASPLAKALSRNSTDELRKMLDAAHRTVQRSQFEVEVIEEALSNAKNGSKTPVAAPPGERPSPAAIRKRVLEIIRERGPSEPKDVKQIVNDDRINVYNALGQLVKERELTRAEGVYALPTSSANGLPPGGLKAGTQPGPPEHQFGP